MNNSEDGTHNITNDPEWPAKVAAYMKKTEDYMGASTGGSLNSDRGVDELEARPIELSHLAQRASLGRSCALNEVVMENLPLDLDLNPLVGVGAWFHDPNYVGTIHNGMDISYEGYVEGPLYATADGVVDTIISNCTVGDRGCGGGWGNYVKIKHDFEGEVYYTQYAHMKSIDLSVGDEVRAGQEIGIMGTTGRSDGNHVHFELWRGDTRIDPYDYFDWTELNLHAPHMSGRDPECELGGVAKTKPGGPSRDEECIVDSPGGNSDIGNLVGNDDEGIAGMLGNMQWESGVSPTRIQSLSADETANSTSAEMDDYFAACPESRYGPGMGLIQWETNYCGIESGGPRFDSLTAWAKSTGKDRWKLETQLEWLTFEMGLEPAPAGTDVWVATASYSIGNQETFEAAMRGNSIEEAVEHFERSVERAGDVRMSERVSAAKEFYAEMDNWK